MADAEYDSAATGALTARISQSADSLGGSGSSADAALSGAVDAARSPGLKGALVDLADRYQGQASSASAYLDRLAGVLERAGRALEATDEELASIIKEARG